MQQYIISLTPLPPAELIFTKPVDDVPTLHSAWMNPAAVMSVRWHAAVFNWRANKSEWCHLQRKEAWEICTPAAAAAALWSQTTGISHLTHTLSLSLQQRLHTEARAARDTHRHTNGHPGCMRTYITLRYTETSSAYLWAPSRLLKPGATPTTPPLRSDAVICLC